MSRPTSDIPSHDHHVSLGPLQLRLVDGDVRYVRVARVEILRRIYVAIRDDVWGTVPGEMSAVSFYRADDRFAMSYRSRHRRDEIDFTWNARISGTIQRTGDHFAATLTFEMDGRAERTFRTNRTGFCVLHPIDECAGRRCWIEHSDGSREQGVFPELVSPEQPFTDVRAIAFEPLPGIETEVSVAGEVFEMEDQRNWTDGSYKTYCRPLGAGFPYELSAGQRVWQSVELHVRGAVPPTAPARASIVVGKPIGAIPKIGLGLTSDTTLTERDVERLRALNLSHVRVDPSSSISDIGVPLEIAVDAPVDGPVPEIPRSLASRAVRWCVYAAGRPMIPADLVERVRQAIRDAGSSVQVGGGTLGNFAELNRDRPPTGAELVAYPINPQIHAFDDLSLVENLQGQTGTVRTVRAFSPKAHIVIGPIILHREPDRFAAGKAPGAETEIVQPDPRQRTAFGAAWTVGSIKRLAEAGAESLTYYQAAGPFGVMDGDELFPMYEVFRAIGEMTDGGEVLSCVSSDPLAFDALAIQKGRHLRLLVACLQPESIEITITGLDDAPRQLRLNGYGVTILDSHLPEGT